MLKIEDVKVGDELVCIDRDGFCEDLPENNEMLDFQNLVVRKNTGTMVFLEGARPSGAQNFISAREVRFFKKKEQSQYTFDDLIDVVRKAFDDHVLTKYSVESLYVDYLPIEYRGRDRSKPRTKCLNLCGVSVESRNNLIQKEIDFIQSLYKETFVIECEEDLKRVKANAKLTLCNGNILTAGDAYHLPMSGFFIFTKGATVEQERGRDD